MSQKKKNDCLGCGTPLSGRQRTWCANIECKRLHQRKLWLEKVYAISLGEYEAISQAQNGVCAICHKPPPAGRSLAVDHEHQDGRSGPIRGLLCFYCNRRILGARSADVIFATADYLRNPPAFQVLGERIAPGRPKKKRSPKRRKR